jgi:hypothetical protein
MMTGQEYNRGAVWWLEAVGEGRRKERVLRGKQD